jgi:uncharacterized Zn finger protein
VRENAESKARRYLAEGRVRVIACDEAAGTVVAEVRGNGSVYATGRGAKGWSCDCPAKSKDCAHVLALKLVTVLEPRGSR